MKFDVYHLHHFVSRHVQKSEGVLLWAVPYSKVWNVSCNELWRNSVNKHLRATTLPCFVYGFFTLAKFLEKPLVILCHCLTCLGHLGRHDTDRIISTFVALPKVVKASTSVPLLRVIVASISALTFANVNIALQTGRCPTLLKQPCFSCFN
jgi:hypothetical protein